jgi:hypothetical protein
MNLCIRRCEVLWGYCRYNRLNNYFPLFFSNLLNAYLYNSRLRVSTQVNLESYRKPRQAEISGVLRKQRMTTWH